MIQFQWLWAFAFLPLPFLVRLALPRARQTRAGALKVPFFQELGTAGLSAQSGRRGRMLRLGALSLIWLLLVAAAARPTFVGTPIPMSVDARDVMLAVDLSGSMASDDLSLDGRIANRLEVVKAVVDDFIGRRTGDRVGLILFGSRAYMQAPLTFDRNVVRELLADATIGMTGQETAIGDAIALAVKSLRTRPEDERVLILLTDGANNAGMLSPLDAAELARQERVKIYTIGVGADRLLFAQDIIARSAGLDEDTLRKIADTTGGRYFRAKDARGLVTIYDDIERMEPTTGDPRYFTPAASLFQWPLGLALVASLLLGAVLAWSRALAPRAAAPAAGAASASVEEAARR